MQRVFVPIDASDYAAAATRRACEVASKTDAEVTGFTILDTVGVEKSTSLPFHAEYRDYPRPKTVARLEDAAEQLNEALSEFDATCKNAAVRSDQVRSSGDPAAAILDISRFYDLLVIGQKTHFHFETEEEPGDTLMRVLDATPVPLFVVPASEATPIKHALIAYDGSPSATRALHAFVDLWRVYQPEVKLLTCEKDKKSGGHWLDQAQKFLQAHGVASVTTELSRKHVIKAVEDDFLDWADLIVAGVRSRHPLQKLFVGSFARFLIDKSHRPLLLCQ